MKFIPAVRLFRGLDFWNYLDNNKGQWTSVSTTPKDQKGRSTVCVCDCMHLCVCEDILEELFVELQSQQLQIIKKEDPLCACGSEHVCLCVCVCACCVWECVCVGGEFQ